MTDENKQAFASGWATCRDACDRIVADHGVPGARQIVGQIRDAIAALTPPADAWRPIDPHIANEWADMAANGLQWLRNIRDGISTVDVALAEMEANCKRIQALQDAEYARAHPPQDRSGQ